MASGSDCPFRTQFSIQDSHSSARLEFFLLPIKTSMCSDAAAVCFQLYGNFGAVTLQ